MFPNLEAEMARKKVSKTQIASLLKISLSSLYHKMDARAFTYDECMRIHDDLFPETKERYLFSKKPEVNV